MGRPSWRGLEEGKDDDCQIDDSSTTVVAEVASLLKLNPVNQQGQTYRTENVELSTIELH